jgi:hypothetical protein
VPDDTGVAVDDDEVANVNIRHPTILLIGYDKLVPVAGIHMGSIALHTPSM